MNKILFLVIAETYLDHIVGPQSQAVLNHVPRRQDHVPSDSLDNAGGGGVVRYVWNNCSHSNANNLVRDVRS